MRALGTPASPGRPLPWWWAYLLLGAAALAAQALLPDGLGRELARVAIGLSTVAAVCLGARRNSPARASGWYLTAAGQLSWLTGSLLAGWSRTVADAGPPVAATVANLLTYPLVVLGVAVLLGTRRSSIDRAWLIDAAILSIGLGLLSWITLGGPAFSDRSAPLTARLIGLAYPTADILLLALLNRLVTAKKARAFRLLTAAAALLLAGDIAVTVVGRSPVYGGRGVDLMWIAAFVLWGSAALHPSMRLLTDGRHDGVLLLSRRRLAALLLAGLITPGALAVELLHHGLVDGWVVVSGSVVLFVLLVARMNLSILQVSAAGARHRRLTDDLAYLAAHDSLTELPNRAQTLHLLQAALHRAQRTGSATGLLLLDLDRFRTINEDVGHEAADELLRVVARRLQDLVRAGDLVGRLSGDEFAVLVEPVVNEASLAVQADRLIAAVSRPILLAGADGHADDPLPAHRVVVGASVGISLSRDGGTDPGELVREAVVAVQRAKAKGRGRAEVFDEVLRRELSERAELEAAIAVGLARGQFRLYYQPVVDLLTGRTRGHEALIRWDRPGYGLVAPDAFIPTAEKSGLICDIGRWTLREATRQLVAWTAAADAGGRAAGAWDSAGVPVDPAAPFTTSHEQRVAVNISGRHLATPGVVDDIVAALAESGLDPRRLIVEITETVLVDDPVAVDRLAAIRRLGVSVGLDDFGTGYTSIGQLQNLPVDNMKIDKSFIDSAEPRSRELVRLMVNAGHAFGLVVVAEGVERPDQLDALREIGCDCVQGYLLSRPLTAEAAGLRVAATAAAHH